MKRRKKLTKFSNKKSIVKPQLPEQVLLNQMKETMTRHVASVMGPLGKAFSLETQ